MKRIIVLSAVLFTSSLILIGCWNTSSEPEPSAEPEPTAKPADSLQRTEVDSAGAVAVPDTLPKKDNH